MTGGFSDVPIIDIGPLVSASDSRHQVTAAIGSACRECGFFYIVGHGVEEPLQERLMRLSRQFFAQDLDTKMEICMARGGRAWRGYFPVGGELTSGKPDLKEGIYFGSELGDGHPLVHAGTPLHGRNLFPDNIPGLRETVLDYMAAMTRLGHTLMSGIALSLGLDALYFAERYTADPLILFRIFNYPPLGASPLPRGTTGGRAQPAPGPLLGKEGVTSASDDGTTWSVGEHTDYGVLTILMQDDTGGLQIKSQARWVDAAPIPGSFVCNIGDMLDRMTGGLYRSTPHRVRNPAHRDRLSFPFFFDPNFNAAVHPIDIAAAVRDDKDERWDRRSVHEFRGTYGEYLLGKVSKVFPELQRAVL